jgi:hypothetical protein
MEVSALCETFIRVYQISRRHIPEVNNFNNFLNVYPYVNLDNIPISHQTYLL